MVKAIAINAALKASSGEPSSSDRMIALVGNALARRGTEWLGTIRLADHDIKPGVTSDEGDGDDWPEMRCRIQDKVPDKVAETVEMLASNSHHLATLLADKPLLGVEQAA
jgi:hypothetical protein